MDARFRSLLESAPDAMVIIDSAGIVVLANGQTERMFGYPLEELVGQPVELLVPGELRARHIAAREGFARHPSVRPMGRGLQLLGARKDGSEFPVEISLGPLEDPQGGSFYCAAVRDVSERQEAERELRASEERFRLTVEASPIGVALLDLDGGLLHANAALCDITGMPRQQLLDLRVHGRVLDVDLNLAALGEEQVRRTERPWVRADGTPLWVDLTLAVVRGSDGRPLHLLAQMLDVTERRSHQKELSRLALTDPLTGLPNRTLFLDRLDQGLAALRRTPGRVSLYLLDLDQFKDVNDTHGHPVGDLLLQELGRRLRTFSRAEDTVARLGGDEFALLTSEPGTSQAQLEHGQRILRALEAPVTLAVAGGSQELTVTGSIGIASSSGADTTASELYRNADLALYRAKDQGRARVSMYDRGLSAGLRERLETERLLRAALSGDGVRVVYQPIIDLQDGALRAYEALVRIVCPEKGELLAPGRFLAAAEQGGLMTHIDLRVLQQCVEELRRPGGPLALHVNVSGSTLRDPAWTQQLLGAVVTEPGLSHRICVEVTEHALMFAGGLAAENVALLRRHGVTVGLDDFGTGYSSLSYLQHLSVDFLKLDKSLVSTICDDPKAATLARSVIELAHALELGVVAEGVTSEAEQVMLASWGCDAAQGYLLGRPGPLPQAG